MVDGTPGTRSSHAQIAYCPVRPAYAGYDAHWRDPLASLQLRTGTFHWLCAALQHEARALCAGRIVFVLEVRPLWPATALVLDVQPLWPATALVLVPPAMGPAVQRRLQAAMACYTCENRASLTWEPRACPSLMHRCPASTH
jgi:hypothetical protein